jgi:hypothetical protein
MFDEKTNYLKNRQEVLSLLSWLPKCEPATHEHLSAHSPS